MVQKATFSTNNYFTISEYFSYTRSDDIRVNECNTFVSQSSAQNDGVLRSPASDATKSRGPLLSNDSQKQALVTMRFTASTTLLRCCII